LANPSVGLIGLGLLGAALAERFLRAGHALVGYDIDPDRRQLLTTLGGQPAESPADVFRNADRIVLSLPTSDVVEAVLGECVPAMSAGSLVIDTTTGDPISRQAMAARLDAIRVRYLEAAVVGSSEQARAGDVVALLGGDPADADACTDLIESFARRSFFVGTWGSAARMKLAVNLVLGLNRAALAEGLAFARAAGLDPVVALDVLRAGAAYSGVMDTKGAKMVGGDFAPQARLSQHLKDVHLILAEAGRTGATVPLSELHRALLDRLVTAGFGDDDNAAIIRAFEQ
jgi:3-hydroxyisobutyrate dehydrogenase-like beta-hydroxyacid dehydrogenase